MITSSREKKISSLIFKSEAATAADANIDAIEILVKIYLQLIVQRLCMLRESQRQKKFVYNKQNGI